MKRKSDTRITQGSGNVFLDLGYPPHEAAVMLLRRASRKPPATR